MPSEHLDVLEDLFGQEGLVLCGGAGGGQPANQAAMAMAVVASNIRPDRSLITLSAAVFPPGTAAIIVPWRRRAAGHRASGAGFCSRRVNFL